MRSIRRSLAMLVAGGSLLFPLLAGNAMGQDLQAVTAEFAPLQMVEQGKPTGFAVEIVEELLRRAKAEHPELTHTISFLPWKRAYVRATKEPNTLFFSLSRTKDRERLFNWIGEISPYEVFFYGLIQDTAPPPRSLQEILEQKQLVGVQALSNVERLLQSVGFRENKDYITYPHYSNGIKMLFHGRFKMLPLTGFAARANTCKLGLPADRMAPVMKLESLSRPLWLAMSRGSDPALLALLPQLFEMLVQEGFVERAQQRFIQRWQQESCGTG